MGAKGLVGYMFLYAKGAKCLVMALCLGPRGQGPCSSPGSATDKYNDTSDVADLCILQFSVRLFLRTFHLL